MANNPAPAKEKISYWKTVSGKIIKSLLIGLGIAGLSYLVVSLGATPDAQIKQMFWVIYYVATAFIVFLSVELTAINKNFKTTSEEIIQQTKATCDEIINQNLSANTEFLRIATNDIEDKILRKLIFTNAVIVDRNNKLAVTAKILNDFPDEKKYINRITDSDNTESIDIVRLFSYQDLLFTPQYLNYLFYRKKYSKKGARRIVVVDEPCQATVSYLFLSCAIGYETFIISSYRFKQFYNEFCRTDGREDTSMIVIKGNPFMTKTENSKGITYDGEYVDYRVRVEHNGDVKNISNRENIWNLLNKLCDASTKIESSDATSIASISMIMTAANRTVLPSLY